MGPMYLLLTLHKVGDFADLVFYPDDKHLNKGHDVILVCLETTSRKAYAYPLKGKGEKVVSEAVKKFLKDIDYKITQLTTDEGKEFINKSMTQILEENDIKHYTNEPGDHCSMGKIDSFIRTLRRLIDNYFTAYNTRKWIDVLPELIANYNNRVHSRIKVSPIEADNSSMAQARIRYLELKKGRPAVEQFKQFQVGDRVRVLNPKHKLEKGSPKFSRAEYTIAAIEGFSFHVKNANGNVLKKTYKAHSLQKIDSVEEKPNIGEAFDEEKHEQEVKEKKKYKRLMREEGITSEVPARIQPARGNRKVKPQGRYNPRTGATKYA